MFKSIPKTQKSRTLKRGIRGKCFYNFIRLLFFSEILSLISEIMFSRSITANLLGTLESCPLFQKICPEFFTTYSISLPYILHAQVILEVVKVLGLGSILISMIQSLMDKTTFGVPYAEIIKDDYYYFRQILVIQLASTIMCIGFSAAGASEGALISLLVMLLGFIYFGSIIDNLLFRTKKREVQAINILKKELSTKKNTREPLLATVQKIAKEVSKDSNSETDTLISCFAQALLSYCRQASNTTDPFERISMIKDVATTWGIALPQKAETKQARFAVKVIVAGLKMDCADVKDMITVSSGLVLNRYMYFYTKTGNEPNQNGYNFLTRLSNYIYSIDCILQEYMYDSQSEDPHVETETINTIRNYQKTLYSLLLWVQAAKHNINLTSELFTVEIFQEIGEYEESLLATVCSANLTRATCDDYQKQKEYFYYIYNRFGFQ